MTDRRPGMLSPAAGFVWGEPTGIRACLPANELAGNNSTKSLRDCSLAIRASGGGMRGG